ncbi:LysR family transcriptional regulator [Metabacillus herbersteinensis]|uniref:LysR family transcriptional regulator n=1 Tax=Metabacillus herbersteinensis TaxID=283816 RepID=A0ABV6GFA6_9BACI
MDFEKIKTFLSVSRNKTFSDAALELHLAQTTVSHRIKSLEEEVDLQLFERGKGRKEVILTPIGEEFYKISEEWLRLENEVQFLRTQGLLLSLIVGSVDSLNSFLFQNTYFQLSNNSNIKLQIKTLHSGEIYSEVEKRHIDIGFSLKNRAHSNVIVDKFFQSPMVVIKSSENIDSISTIIHPKDLDTQNEVFLPWGEEYISWHAYWWDPLSISRVNMDNSNILLKLLENKEKWAIVPKFIAEGVSSKYKIFELVDRPPDYVVYKLTHKSPTTLSNQAIDYFIKCYQENLG